VTGLAPWDFEFASMQPFISQLSTPNPNLRLNLKKEQLLEKELVLEEVASALNRYPHKTKIKNAKPLPQNVKP